MLIFRWKQEQANDLSKKDVELDQVQRIIHDQKKEIEVLNEEIAALKDANLRGPTTSMKNLVERLKNQLALKEKQHQVDICFCITWEQFVGVCGNVSCTTPFICL